MEPNSRNASAARESTGKGSFEDKLQKLEGIVRTLEKGEMPLASSLERFEEGVGLVKQLREELDAARGRVEALMVRADGSCEVEDFK